MKTITIEITLGELQEALRDYCLKRGVVQPQTVQIVSHSKCISVQLLPQGLVEADEFRHRAGVIE